MSTKMEKLLKQKAKIDKELAVLAELENDKKYLKQFENKIAEGQDNYDLSLQLRDESRAIIEPIARKIIEVLIKIQEKSNFVFLIHNFPRKLEDIFEYGTWGDDPTGYELKLGCGTLKIWVGGHQTRGANGYTIHYHSGVNHSEFFPNMDSFLSNFIDRIALKQDYSNN